MESRRSLGEVRATRWGKGPIFQESSRITGGDRYSLALLAYTLACAGRETEARRTLEAASVGHPASAFLAPAHLALGDAEGARKVLREAEANGCPWSGFVWCSPALAGLGVGQAPAQAALTR